MVNFFNSFSLPSPFQRKAVTANVRPMRDGVRFGINPPLIIHSLAARVSIDNDLTTAISKRRRYADVTIPSRRTLAPNGPFCPSVPAFITKTTHH